MIELPTEHQDGAVAVRELQSRVYTVANTMSESEAQLSRSLVSLLVHVERLKQLKPLWLQNNSLQPPPSIENGITTSSVYDALDRQVSTLKAQRADTDGTDSRGENGASTREETEAALLWSRIEWERKARAGRSEAWSQSSPYFRRCALLNTFLPDPHSTVPCRPSTVLHRPSTGRLQRRLLGQSVTQLHLRALPKIRYISLSCHRMVSNPSNDGLGV